jgi:hypothetical protein
MKSTLNALSWTLGAFVLAVVMTLPVQARISIEGLGGDIEIEGFLSSEARANVGSGESRLTQWIQRLQIEATVQYTDVGIFDELSFTGIIRPEFDAAYYQGLSGVNNRQSGAQSYYGTAEFANASDPVGFGGFDFAFTRADNANFLSTGGIGKIVHHGLENPGWLANNFEVIAGRTGVGGNNFSIGQAINGGFSGFPLFGTTGQQIKL